MRHYAFVFVAAAAGLLMPASASPQNAGRKNSTAQAGISPARKYFTDVPLVNQNGETLRFYTDLLQGKVVVVNSFFASCTSVCPPMMHKLSQLQDALGDHLGKDVFFLSISVDPVSDTPPKLKEYAARNRAKPGWHFLTGKKENVDWALYKVGQYVDSREEHSILLIIGNEPKGDWRKVLSTGRTEEIVRILQEVLNSK